ncbi:MAG: YaiI/YqxD family protein [Campylobacterales bacterium]
MRLFVDGDAFPNLLKPIVVRAIEKKSLQTIVVSNKKIYLGDSELITYYIVEQGADVADNHIVQMVEEGELVITADIPLADKIIAKGAHAIDHRGELYSKENIKHYLAMRNLMEEIRSMGETTKGPPPFNKKDVHAFSNQLQKFLTRV